MTAPESRLVEALRDYERLAPDPAAVTAGVHAGIARRRHRRRLQGVVAIAVTTVVAVTAGVAAVGGLRADEPHPATSPTPSAPPVTEWPHTLTFDWLPAGFTPSTVSSTKVEESIEFRASGGRYLEVTMTKVAWAPALDLRGWRRTTVNGRPAREVSQPARSSVVFQLPSGRWVNLELGWRYGTSGNHQPNLHKDALRVARGVQTSGDNRLRVGFTLQYLPAGQHIIGVHKSAPGENSQETISCASGSLRVLGTETLGDTAGNLYQVPQVDEGEQLFIRIGERSVEPHQLERTGRRIPDIQGRTAYAINRDAQVVVLDFHGRDLVVTGNSLPLSEHVKIAEGVRLI